MYIGICFSQMPNELKSILNYLLAYCHVNKEPDNRALQLPARLYGYHCEQKTPHSEQDEDYGDEDQLHFNFLDGVRHSGGKDGLIGLKLDVCV